MTVAAGEPAPADNETIVATLFPHVSAAASGTCHVTHCRVTEVNKGPNNE